MTRGNVIDMQKTSSRTAESCLGCGDLSHVSAKPNPFRPGLRVSRARFGILILASALGFAAACSSDASPGATGGAGGSGGSTGTGTGGAGGMCNATSTACACQTTHMDTYVANMAKVGTSNKLTFQLIQSNPGPPVKGLNDWKVKITDGTGTAIGDGLSVHVWMPAHVHDSPTSPKITYETATSTFSLSPIDLSLMGGTWRATLTVTDASNMTVDVADFDFCVD
jgi:hypothetical protein